MNFILLGRFHAFPLKDKFYKKNIEMLKISYNYFYF